MANFRLEHLFGPTHSPIVLAHRGFSATGMENTMSAFSAAIDLGVRYLETDVQTTKDGRVVAFHDRKLRRLTGHPGRVADLEWSQLKQLRVRGQEPIAELAEVLASWPHLGVNIDVKQWAAVRPLARLLTIQPSLYRFCVGSFQDQRTAAVAELVGPGLGTACGPRTAAAWFLAGTGPWPTRRIRRLPPSAVAMQVPARILGRKTVTRDSLALAQEHSLAVHCWTINDPQQMSALVQLGVNGLVTDRSDLALTVLSGGPDDRPAR